MKLHFLDAQRKGIVYYRLPSNDDMGDLMTKCPIRHAVGVYDIFYDDSWGNGHYFWSRTAKGTVTVTIEKGHIHAHVAFDGSKEWTFGDWTRKNFVITETEENELEAKFIDDRVTAFFQERYAFPSPMIAKLSKLDKGFACPWIPQECLGSDIEEGAAMPNYFESVEEHTQAMWRERNMGHGDLEKANNILRGGDPSKSWLCNHMELPREAAALIHRYVATKPLPVLMFEPGDLVIECNWLLEHHGEYCGSYVFARKRADVVR